MPINFPYPGPARDGATEITDLRHRTVVTEERRKAPRRKRHWDKIIAVVLATIAIALLAYALMTESPTETDTTDHGGMWDQRTYSSTNLAMIVLASFLIAIAVMFILLRQSYEPLPPEMTKLPPPPPPTATPKKEDPTPEGVVGVPATVPVPQASAPAPATEKGAPDEDEAARENYLVLRLLTGDERIMFKAVMDNGGEALQKDLILRTKMSNAKVSRLLDRLEEKGVVTKERHGSTNKVRIKLES